MSRVLLLVPALAWATGGRHAAHAIEDFAMLLQKATAAPTLEQNETEREEYIRKKFPDLSNILTEVQDSVQGVTDQVGEVMDETSQKVDEISEQVHQIASDTGKKIAAALNHVLDLVKKESDKLFEVTMVEKTRFYQELNHTLAASNATILPEFERETNKVVLSTWSQWQMLRYLVQQTAGSIEKGLRSAGQLQLSEKLHMMVDSAVQSLNDFMMMLRDADEDLHGLDQMAVSEAQGVLFKVNDKFNQAMQYVVTFVVKYQQIFQEIIDRISNALTTSTEAVDNAFATVQQNVTAVAWRVRSSGRELLLGMHHAIVMVAQAKEMPEPEWHPVTMPTAAPFDWGAAAVGARSSLLAVFAAVAALAISAGN